MHSVDEKLKLLILSGNPLISIETADESRAMQLVRAVAGDIPRPMLEWSMTTGLRRLGEPRVANLAEPGDAGGALTYIAKNTERAVYVLRDLGPHCKDAMVHRIVRDLVELLPRKQGTIVLIDALPVPEELRRFTVRYEVGLPGIEELEEVVRRTFKTIRDTSLVETNARITKRQMEQLVQSLRGLSCREAERVVASAIYNDYALDGSDLGHIVEAKRNLLRSAGSLEAIAADVQPDEIGGLDNLKAWLRQRRGGFSREAREFGLEPPRGVLMLGVPGCGKSLCAKVVASDWHMPLLRLDPGVLYQKYIGESESQLRQALAQAEAMAPTVLWIDEIEKAFASASAASADGGLSKRMFGTLLSWMQDHRHPIFIIATANDISALPPELMRKGRFDEVFFVDLPNEKTREQILGIHLAKRNRTPDGYSLRELAKVSEGFTGSELEQAVVSALFAAFAEKSELQDRHLLAEIRKTRPLSVLLGERIDELRAWADGRCVPAD